MKPNLTYAKMIMSQRLYGRKLFVKYWVSLTQLPTYLGVNEPGFKLLSCSPKKIPYLVISKKTSAKLTLNNRSPTGCLGDGKGGYCINDWSRLF